MAPFSMHCMHAGLLSLSSEVCPTRQRLVSKRTSSQIVPEGQLMSKERPAAFADAILALIMTMLVLALDAPKEPTPEGFWNLRMSCFSYVLSFFWLGSLWTGFNEVWDTSGRIDSACHVDARAAFLRLSHPLHDRPRQQAFRQSHHAVRLWPCGPCYGRCKLDAPSDPREAGCRCRGPPRFFPQVAPSSRPRHRNQACRPGCICRHLAACRDVRRACRCSLFLLHALEGDRDILSYGSRPYR